MVALAADARVIHVSHDLDEANQEHFASRGLIGQHSLTKRSPINPLAPVLLPIDIKASYKVYGKVLSNPLFWPAYPAVATKGKLTGFLASGVPFFG